MNARLVVSWKAGLLRLALGLLLWPPLIVSTAIIVPEVADAASGKSACAMLGMFDARAKAACEAAASMRGSGQQGQNSGETTARTVSGGQQTDQSSNTPADGSGSTPLPAQSTSRTGGRSTAASSIPANQSKGSASGDAAARRGVTASPLADDGAYRSDKFNGLTTWRDLFSKAANSPAEFAQIRAKMTADSNSMQAAMTGTIFPGRNNLQKLLTDYQLYKLYENSDATLFVKQNQCLMPRTYSPEEVCDCLAGFPGNTLIGPGAGELITNTNNTISVKACATAAANAPTPALKARYLAQRARAQVHTADPAQAVAWADEAIKAGYGRAAIIKAEANLWDVEVMSRGFPPMTQIQYDAEMKAGIANLKAARQAGVRETYIVAEKYQQSLARAKFNNAVLTPLVKAMASSPSRGKCLPDSMGADGRPIAGSGCAGVDPR